MTREEQIIETAKFIYSPSSGIPQSLPLRVGFIEGAKWADKTMIYKACKCFCDNLCEKSLCGMCFHKYEGEHQIKNSFQYNECNELQLLRKAMEE